MESGTGTIVAFVVLFVLVAIAIILAIIALFSASNNQGRQPFAVYDITDSGDTSLEITKQTYIYYDVNSDSSLKLSGTRGMFVVITNYSNESIINIRSALGTSFKSHNGTIKGKQYFELKPDQTVIIVWSNERRARITRI